MMINRDMINHEAAALYNALERVVSPFIHIALNILHPFFLNYFQMFE